MQNSIMPPINFSILDYKSNDQLNVLMENDDELTKLAKDIHFVTAQENSKNDVMMTNLSLAEYNLKCESRLEGLKHQLLIGYETANRYRDEIKENKPKLEKLSNKYSLDVILALLQTEAAQNDETCEHLMNKLLTGDKDISDFIEDFLFMRQKYYTKKIKADKMQEIMLKQSSSASVSSMPYNPNYIPGSYIPLSEYINVQPNDYGRQPYPEYPNLYKQ